MRIVEALIERRPGASRWPYVLTALLAFLFVGHAYEDAGWRSGLIYLGIIAVSVVTAIRPNVLGWSVLLGIFMAYGTLVLFTMRNGPLNEWAIFVSLGYVPALLLYVLRPQKNIGRLRVKDGVQR